MKPLCRHEPIMLECTGVCGCCGKIVPDPEEDDDEADTDSWPEEESMDALGQPNCTLSIRREFMRGPLDGAMSWRIAGGCPVVSFQCQFVAGYHTYIDHPNIGMIYCGVMEQASGDELQVTL